MSIRSTYLTSAFCSSFILHHFHDFYAHQLKHAWIYIIIGCLIKIKQSFLHFLYILIFQNIVRFSIKSFVFFLPLYHLGNLINSKHDLIEWPSILQCLRVNFPLLKPLQSAVKDFDPSKLFLFIAKIETLLYPNIKFVTRFCFSTCNTKQNAQLTLGKRSIDNIWLRTDSFASEKPHKKLH